MIDALIQGALVTEPQKRQTRDGKPFYTASLRASPGDGEALFVSLTTFSESAGERLLAVAKRANIAAVGAFEQYQYQGKDRTDRSGWRLTATEVMSVCQARKRRGSNNGESE